MERLAEYLHLLFCDATHEGDPEDLITQRKPGVCYFYIEDAFANPWNRPDHTIWKEEALKTINALRAPSPVEAIRSIQRIMEILEKIQTFTESELDYLLSLLIDTNPSPADTGPSTDPTHDEEG